MKSLRSFFLWMLVVLGLAAGSARNASAQSAATPYCPAATITDARVAQAATFNLSEIRQYTQLNSNYNVTSGSAFNYVSMVAHRGIWEFCPESTMESYEAALDSGVEGVEMDFRLSAPGFDPSSGINYPNGEMFLTHDISLRGEAPDVDNTNPQNVIYSATPESLAGRPMVDRAGRPAYANSCVPVPVPVTPGCSNPTTPIVLHSLTDLLTHILAKARANSSTISPGAGDLGRDLLVRAPELVLDIKGGEPELKVSGDPQNTLPNVACEDGIAAHEGLKYCNSSTFDGVTEAMAEVNRFEVANNIDLEQMIVYKFVSINMTSAQWETLVSGYYGDQGANGPGLVLIAYNTGSNKVPPEIYPISSANPGRGYQTYNGYFMSNWNIQWDNISTWQWNMDDLLGLSPATGIHGTETFQAGNGFPEGTRWSAGQCCHAPQSLQTWGQATIEFSYQPPSSPLRPFSGWEYNVITTAITLDAYQNANRYLTNRGLRFTNRIQ